MKRFAGHIVFVAGIVTFLVVGDPFAAATKLTLRNVVALLAFPWLAAYCAYQCGWITGYFTGKRDELAAKHSARPKRRLRNETAED